MLYAGEPVVCFNCQSTYNPTWSDPEIYCPTCASPVIPELDQDELLIYGAEQHIARDERGVHLTESLVTWLRLQGIKKRSMVRECEELFYAVSSAREAANAERITKDMKSNKDQPE